MGQNNNYSKQKPVLEIAHAPYNFVSIDEDVFSRYEINEKFTDPNKVFEKLPDHSRFCKDTINGFITFTVKAETPIMISGQYSIKEKKEFIKNSSGEYIIPGSTLKGLLRSNMTILGLCSIGEYVEDNRFLYRAIADESKKLKKQYDKRVGLKTAEDKSISKIENVRAGYIYKISDDDYRIKPAVSEKGKTYFRVSEKTLQEKWRNLAGVNFMYRNSRVSDRNFQYKPYFTKVDYEINYDKMTVKNLKNPDSSNGKQGFITCAGFMNKKKSHYVVTEINNDADDIRIPIEEIRGYEKDLRLNKKDGFYSLPERKGIGNARPIFYAKYNNRLYFSYTPYLRILYDYSVKNGLSDMHKNNEIIDYAKSIFGFTDIKNKSYKGRVSAEDAKLLNNAGIESPFEIVLAAPKATCFPNYLKQPYGTDKSKLKSYNDQDFSIRGIKNYWIKDKVLAEKAKDNVNINIYPLKAGTTFKGKIYFENLKEDELGLLLWSLILDEKCQQNIGMGKAYGFGRITINDVKLQIEDIFKKYSIFTGDFYNNGDVNEYIKKYKDYMFKKGINIEDKLSVKELILMKSNVVDGGSEKFKYMSLKHIVYGNEFSQRAVLPDIFNTLGYKEPERQQCYKKDENIKQINEAVKQEKNQYNSDRKIEQKTMGNVTKKADKTGGEYYDGPEVDLSKLAQKYGRNNDGNIAKNKKRR